MVDIGILEAKTHFSEWVDRACAGEEVTVTRHGKPLVKLVPVDDREARALRARETIERLRKLRESIKPKGKPIPWEELKEMGRKW